MAGLLEEPRLRRNPIKSSARALEVLELFTVLRRPLRLDEIHQALDLPQSSATVLMKTLIASGYINYTRSTRSYFPTVRVSGLGDWIVDLMLGPGSLGELIGDLSRQSDETVAVSAQNDIYVQHLKIVKPTHAYTLSPPEGTMRFLTASAPGLTLLSQMPHASVDRIAREIVRHGGGEVDRDQLRGFREARRVTLDGLPVEGYSVFSMPLPGAGHGIPLCLAVGGTSARMRSRQSEILAAMNRTCDRYAAGLAP